MEPLIGLQPLPMFPLYYVGVKFETFTRQLADVDRCLCDGVKDGFVKIITKVGKCFVLFRVIRKFFLTM